MPPPFVISQMEMVILHDFAAQVSLNDFSESEVWRGVEGEQLPLLWLKCFGYHSKVNSGKKNQGDWKMNHSTHALL